ncbi:hypothetical protein GEMRC1_014047 [Eukaryota sp. GEM-RC1]
MVPPLCALDFDVFHVDGESNLFADLLSSLVPEQNSEAHKAASLLKVSQSWLPLGSMGDLELGPDEGFLPRDPPSGLVKQHAMRPTAEFWLKSCAPMDDADPPPEVFSVSSLNADSGTPMKFTPVSTSALIALA